MFLVLEIMPLYYFYLISVKMCGTDRSWPSSHKRGVVIWTNLSFSYKVISGSYVQLNSIKRELLDLFLIHKSYRTIRKRANEIVNIKIETLASKRRPLFTSSGLVEISVKFDKSIFETLFRSISWLLIFSSIQSKYWWRRV